MPPTKIKKFVTVQSVEGFRLDSFKVSYVCDCGRINEANLSELLKSKHFCEQCNKRHRLSIEVIN